MTRSHKKLLPQNWTQLPKRTWKRATAKCYNYNLYMYLLLFKRNRGQYSGIVRSRFKMDRTFAPQLFKYFSHFSERLGRGKVQDFTIVLITPTINISRKLQIVTYHLSICKLSHSIPISFFPSFFYIYINVDYWCHSVCQIQISENETNSSNVYSCYIDNKICFRFHFSTNDTQNIQRQESSCDVHL